MNRDARASTLLSFKKKKIAEIADKIINDKNHFLPDFNSSFVRWAISNPVGIDRRRIVISRNIL